MQIRSTIKYTFLKIFKKRYKIFKKKEYSEDLLYICDTVNYDIFILSDYYQKIKNLQIKKSIFKNTDEFLNFIKQLKNHNLINNDEEIALYFCAKKIPELDIDSLNILSHYKNINQAMQKLLKNSINKLKMINDITSNSEY